MTVRGVRLGKEDPRRKELAERFPRPAPPYCNAEMYCEPGHFLFGCTRARGHSGIHVAHNSIREAVGYWVRGE